MSLYHKYRPTTLDGMVGNSDTITALETMLEDRELYPHAFLFTGQTGCGKTTIARIIAKDLNCSYEDLKEINTANFRGIDTVREIIQQSQFKPIAGACKVWIIDECHKLTNDAQNALLKILEDPPKRVYFILCTTAPQKLIDEIKGRCSQFQMKPLTERQMFILLRRVLKAEGKSLKKIVYEQIILDSLGLPRNALQILEQVMQVDEDKQLEIAKRSAEQVSESIELCRALMKPTPWKQVANILNNLKDQEAEGIRRHVLGYCQAILLKESNDRAARVIEEFWESFYYIGFPGLVYSCYSLIKN